MHLQTLGEICDRCGGVIQTGPFGSQLHESDYSADGLPVIMPKDIAEGRINSETVARIPEHKADQLARHKVSNGTIVMPRRGEISKRAFIREDEAGWLCGTGCIKIELKGAALLPRFLYYYLDMPSMVEWIERKAVGTTMLNLNTSIIRQIPVPVLSLDIQNKIASILSAYDDLIENNQRRIRLLEDSTRLLYQEWFVRLRFPGHEHTPIVDGVPEGWERKKLSDVLTLHYGKALKESDRVEGSIPVFGSSGIVGAHNRALVKGPGIIVGRKGNVGSVFWSDTDFFAIDTVYYIDSATSSLFLYGNLQNQNFQNSDGAVPGLNRNHAYSLPIVIPPKGLRDAYEEAVKPVYDQMCILKNQSQKLKQARDLLLPRLMSGEIPV
ncbi:restriction endonuclease subunit S, partial [Geobacter anodireducens]|uniref:restriction endonuclease subunit S n=1 Tax=Geobacter soli TaxID=1510391 RepID=UPI0005808E45